jgi:hypothetical protein
MNFAFETTAEVLFSAKLTEELLLGTESVCMGYNFIFSLTVSCAKQLSDASRKNINTKCLQYISSKIFHQLDT